MTVERRYELSLIGGVDIEESIKIMKVVKTKEEYCQEILKVLRNLK